MKERFSLSNPSGIAPNRPKDINALSKLFAPNMIYVDHEGTLQTREQFLNSVKNDASPLDQLVTEDVVTRSFGDTVVVTGVYRGKSTKNGKTTVIRGRFTDTWARINGNWQCISDIYQALCTPISGRALTVRSHFDGDSWWAHVKYLADDSLEGHDTGSDGLQKAKA